MLPRLLQSRYFSEEVRAPCQVLAGCKERPCRLWQAQSHLNCGSWGNRDKSHHRKAGSARWDCEDHVKYTGNRQVQQNRSLLLPLKQEEEVSEFLSWLTVLCIQGIRETSKNTQVSLSSEMARETKEEKIRGHYWLLKSGSPAGINTVLGSHRRHVNPQFPRKKHQLSEM